MYSRTNLYILFILLITCCFYAQTNVGGNITTNQTWTVSGSPYSVTSTLTIRDGATLTIDSDVVVIFPGSSNINVGSSTSSTGSIIAYGVKFKSLSSSDSKINIKYNSSSGFFSACTFDNVYLIIDNAQVTLTFVVFDNCNYPLSLVDEGRISLSNFIISPNNVHIGIERTGTISHDFELENYKVPYFLDALTVRDGATLTIEDSAEVYFPSSTGIYVGSSSTSIGHFIANDVQFFGLGSSDAQIAFRANSTGNITACSFKNAYLNIDNASPEIKNCKFSKCVNAIYTRNNATPSILNNDFFNNTTALKNTGTNTVTAENNFWGHFTGPQHTNNPTGLGQEIEGSVDFQPFLQNPINGSIQPQFTVNVVEVAEARVGSYKDTEIKFLTSTGEVDLLITNIESDSDTFTVKSSKYFWVTSGDTASIKIRFTPTSSSEFSGNLNLYTNQQTNSTITLPVKGKGTSFLSLSSDTLNFGKVDLKDYKTLKLMLRNEGTTSIHVDSIVSTNSNFNYVLGSYPLEINENLYSDESSFLKNDGSTINSLSGFYISPRDSENVLVTYKPRSMIVETGYLKIYYKGYGVETIFLTGEGYSAPIAVRISSLNFQNFPFIYLNAIAENYGVPIETLTKSNFQIFENGVLQESHFNITQPGEGQGSRLADIVFIMDNSGSLQNERDAVAQNVNNFVNSLSTSGIDYALGLCRYGSSNQSGIPIIEDNGILTTDVEYFKSSVWTRNETGGGTEPGYLAIKQSASDFSFRPGSQKIFIIITDETPKQGSGTLNEALSICMNNSITLFALSLENLYDYFTPITDATHGSVYNITSNFNDILTYISTAVSSSYILEYSSSSPEYDNVFREVVVKVEYQGNSNTDTVYYNPLSLPRIQRTSETQKFHEKSWTEGTMFKIQVLIKDEYEPFVKYARLYFRETGTPSYTFLPMSFDGNDLYSATIPGTYSEPPGVDYYITASDSISTTSDPKNNPALMPYQIAILPNVAPVITHTPVGFAQLNTAVQIDATIEDITNSINSAVLYYKKPGQLSYQSTSMNSLGSNNYSVSIPGIWNTRDGLEYYIRATDDFNLSNYHGTYDSPHKIAVAATVLNAQIDTLSIGPSIQNVIVPSNGAGYCYFNFNYLNNPYYSNSTITIKLWVQNDLFETEGIFIKPGLLRIKIPSVIVLDSSVIFTLANQISFNDSLFNINGSSFQIKTTKIPAEFKRSWDVFASGSAGVSGTVGSIGAGASAAAAKLSVKGTAGGGLTISKDQDNKLSLDRRLEASVAVGLEVPSLNAVGAKATVGTGTITVKALLGQEYCFSDINLSEDKKQMAQAGFLLETFSIAGVGLSPIVGPILKAVIDVLNSAGGVNSTFEQAHISDYWGTGLEGSIGAGFQIKAQAVNLNALNSTASIALNLKFIDYFRKSGKRLKKLSSLTDYVGHSIELSQAIGFSFSTLDFGLKANDKVELQGGNLSLFDAGLGTEISATADFTSSFGFDGLTVSLTGGGGLTMFGTTKDKYYTTEIEFPKEYGQVFTNVGSALAGFFSSSKTIPLGSDLVNVTVQSLKDAYNNIKPVPIKITTLEKRGKGFSLDFSIDLDAALLLGVGVSLGVTAKYYDEVEFPKKVSNVYLSGNNFLLYTSNYNSDMESDHFTDVVKDLLSGTLPLIKEAFSNILETLTEIVVAGKKFVISVVTKTGDVVGEVASEAKEAGKWVVTQFSSWLPMSYQKHQFEKPIFKKMYYSTRVMHPDNTGVRKLAMVDSKLILVSETMVVNFYKTGSTSSEKSVEDPYQIKMIIKDNTLLENYFTTDDKDKVKFYYYDDELLNWVLVGGTRNGDTLTASVNMLGSFALGIEINSMNDSKAPSILEYGPTSGSIQTNYPEIYMIVKDDEYGSGLDLSRSFIILNGDTLNYSFDPAESKIYYQLSRGDSLKTSTMYVQIICTDLAGNISSTNFEFNLDLTGVNKEKDIPDKFALYQNYPNPFNPSTTIRFDIPQKTSVEINIYDIRGSFVVTLFSGKLDPGHHSIIWKGVNNYGSQVASGIYFYQIKTEEFNAVRKMQVIK